MDTFNLRAYLKENRLLEDEFISEVDQKAIVAAAAKALKIKPEQVKTSEKDSKEPVEEIAIGTIALIAGLVPPALELVGGTLNKAKQLFGLDDTEKKELEKLNNEIKKAKKLVKDFDSKQTGGQSPEEQRARKLLQQYQEEKDKKFGSKLGNMAKHAGHSLHSAYTAPIRGFLKLVGLTAGGPLKDEKYREKLANIIYAAIMIGVAGVGVMGHIKHLTGVGPVITTIADLIKEGLSIKDVIKSVAKMI
jgi:hypothetical protein